MTLNTIVPWGRNLAEYQAMFQLTDQDLQSRILGCGDGPSSFNAEATQLGTEVISIDPVYQFSREQIRSRIDEVAAEVMAQVRLHQNNFVWESIPTLEALESIRMEAMGRFLEDYPHTRRYRCESLPHLSFDDQQFDLALSSHFLLLYSEALDFNFHLEAILEMLRVAKEVRIFPIVDLTHTRSKHLDTLIERLEQHHYQCDIIPTAYEFQRGANEMLRIR